MFPPSFRNIGKCHWALQSRFRVCFCLALFALLYGLACAGGSKLTYDSMAYLAAAKSVREGTMLLNQFGKPYISWPPLYPFLLSVGIGWLQPFVFLFHLLCALTTLYFWDRLAVEVLKTPEWRFWFLLVLSLSTPFLMSFVFVWSEAVFLLLLTVYLFYLQQFIKYNTRSDIIGAVIFAFLMLLQRNAGIFLFASVAAGVLFNVSFFHKKQLKFLLLHFLFGVSGFGAWNLYVLILKGNEQLLTEVEPAFSWQGNVALVLSEAGKLYVPEPGSFLFGILFLVPCLLFVCYTLYQEKDVWLRLLIVLLLAYFMVWVIVPAVWVVVPAGKEDISRFLSVIIPVLHLFVFFFLERQTQRVKKKSRVLVFALVACWLVYPALRIIANTMLWHHMQGL